MNAFAKVDKAAFLHFAAEHAGERYEFGRGRIVQQITGGTHDHGPIARRSARRIEDQIDASSWTVLLYRGVEGREKIRYPDVVVEPASEPGASLATRRPSLIVEVLPPSTSAADLDQKPDEYLAVGSLDAYVFASQDEAAMLVYARDADGACPARPLEIEGIDRTITIKGRPFDLTVSLSAVYEGIV